MIKTIRPFGSIANQIVKYKFEMSEKYYVVDDLYDDGSSVITVYYGSERIFIN